MAESRGTAQFLRSEKHLIAALESLRQAINSIESLARSSSVSETKKAVRAATNTLTLSKQNLRRLEVSVDSVGVVDQMTCRSKCTKYKEEIEHAEKRLREIKSNVERKELFGVSQGFDAAASSGAKTGLTEEEEDQQLLSQTMESLERSNYYLDDSRQVLGETEEIGINVLENLDQQRETLLRASNNVKQTNSAAEEARIALKRMARRACYNIAVLYVIIILLVAAIFLVIYLKFLK